MQLAWQFVKQNRYGMGLALEVAWVNQKLVQQMRNSVVEFEFIKMDGGVRHARGTLKTDMCPPVKGGLKPRNKSVQIFFDVDKGEWRCFKKHKLIDYKINVCSGSDVGVNR